MIIFRGAGLAGHPVRIAESVFKRLSLLIMAFIASFFESVTYNNWSGGDQA